MTIGSVVDFFILLYTTFLHRLAGHRLQLRDWWRRKCVWS